MFPLIETIIKDGQFSGCNINIKTTPNNTLAAVLTFLVPSNANDISLANSTNNKEQLDNIYALRSGLSRPLVVLDTGNGLNDAVEQALSNISESLIAGAKTLSAIDIAGLIEAATAKVATKAKPESVKKVATKPSKAKATVAAKVTQTQPSTKAVEEVTEETEETSPAQSWETDLESL